MTDRIVYIENLGFSWPGQARSLEIGTFEIAAHERVFLQGPSGSGKSTLLGLIAGVLAPQQGRLDVLGQSLPGLSTAQRDRMRAESLGVIFQMFNLVPYLSVLQNVSLPCRFSPARRAAVDKAGGVEAEARRLLSALGLSSSDILNRKVIALSVGQQQRVAAARALIGNPALIIADEPTSALDADSRDRFIDLLSAQVTKSGASLLFVSHDSDLSRSFDRCVSLPQLNQALNKAVRMS